MKKLLLTCICALVLVGCGGNEVNSDPKTAKEGDIVQIDYVGYLDGETFSGGSANDQTLLIGAGNYIDGFEEGLVGMKEGETKDVDMTFPENYTEELAGKDVTFKMTLDKVYEETQGKAKDDMIAVCDFVVSFEGIDGTSTLSDQLIKIGAGQYLEDIENGVEGLSVGESTEVVIKYPDNDAYGIYAGVTATFKITITGLYE